MPVSYFERKLAVNEGSKKVGVEMHIGSNLRVKEVENVLDRTGVDFRQETIKYKSEDGSGTVAGPSGGGEAGFKRTKKGGNLTAKAELSLARAEKNFQVTENNWAPT